MADIVTWVGLLVIRNKKVLMVRESDKDFFVLPGGRIELNESQEETLKRELFEELNVEFVDIKLFGEYELPGKAEGTLMKFILYFGEIVGEPKPNDVEEYRWVDSTYEKENIKVGSITSMKVFPELKEKDLIG